nr:hypothetical protein [Janthinobacterium lividum]
MNADTQASSHYAPSPHGMYLRHFGLRTAPFGITPDLAFFIRAIHGANCSMRCCMPSRKAKASSS